MSRKPEGDVLLRRATVRNFARIKWAELKPEGAVIVVGGRNAQGKSSLINALIAGIGGKKFLPEKPVRKGEKSLETEIELGSEETTEFTIRQYMTADGRYGLQVRTRDGFVHPQGQTFLDSFYSRLSFDPFQFVRAKDKDQVELANKALGLDLSGLNFKRLQAFDERTIVNREVSSLEAKLRDRPEFPFDPDAPKEKVSVSELSSQYQEAVKHNQAIEEDRAALSRKKEDVEDLKAEAKRLSEEAAEFRRKAEECERKAKNRLEAADTASAELAAEDDALLSRKPKDAEAIREKIQKAEDINRQVDETAERTRLGDELATAKKKSQALSDAIARVDAEKEATVKKAKFPIEGFTMTENGVYLNGLPFGQASSAEQLRVSLHMAFLQRAPLKVFFCKEGGLFDADSLNVIAEEAAAAGVQIILELPTRRQGDEEFATVIVEDGLIKGAPDAPDAETFLDSLD